jgi:hypothetical protein
VFSQRKNWKYRSEPVDNWREPDWRVAHSRDLIYVSKLVKAYHTDEKVMMTLQLAEKCGIDTLLCNPQLARIKISTGVKRRGRSSFSRIVAIRMVSWRG